MVVHNTSDRTSEALRVCTSTQATIELENKSRKNYANIFDRDANWKCFCVLLVQRFLYAQTEFWAHWKSVAAVLGIKHKKPPHHHVANIERIERWQQRRDAIVSFTIWWELGSPLRFYGSRFIAAHNRNIWSHALRIDEITRLFFIQDDRRNKRFWCSFLFAVFLFFFVSPFFSKRCCVRCANNAK